MSTETFQWLVVAALGAGTPALFVMFWRIARLMRMHEDPESTGFGTIGIKEVIEHNTRAFKQLSYYLQWHTKQTGGDDAPPYVEDPRA